MKLKDYTVKRYESKYFSDWNAFISTAKNATFLFNRNFMEYHSDRFEDFSLMIYHEVKLVAVLPATRDGATVFSHPGFTYGGIVLTLTSNLYNLILLLILMLLFFVQCQVNVNNII